MAEKTVTRGSKKVDRRDSTAASDAALPETSDTATADLYLELLGLDDDGRRRLKSEIANCYRLLDTGRL